MRRVMLIATALVLATLLMGQWAPATKDPPIKQSWAIWIDSPSWFKCRFCELAKAGLTQQFPGVPVREIKRSEQEAEDLRIEEFPRIRVVWTVVGYGPNERDQLTHKIRQLTE